MAHHRTPGEPRQRFRVRWRRIIGVCVLVGLILPALGLGLGVHSAITDAKSVKTEYHARNFEKLASTLQRLGRTLGIMRTEALLLGWMDVIPWVRGYYLNGMNLLTVGRDDLYVFGQVVPPVLQATHASGSTAAKAKKVSNAVTDAGLTMSQLAPELQAANRAVQKMNPSRMPTFLANKGLKVSSLRSLSHTMMEALPAMTGPHPVLANILGLPSAVRYLLIFQNSGELRATGGFMTAYAFVPFSDGKLGPIHSQNIQSLDSAVTYQPAAPLPVSFYLPVSYWHLRDANTAMPGTGSGVPDVPEAVSNIMRFYNSIPKAPYINGIVFINTWFVDNLIADVGGLTVPTVRGASVHITAQNANYEMEMMAEGEALPTSERKLFIGTMMKELMHQVFHGHFSELLKVASTLTQGLSHEQVMLLFHNNHAENLVAQHNWGGIIPAQVNGNFLEVVDQNLLGHKDNYWMRESYSVNIQTIDGRHLETVTNHWVEPAIVVNASPYLVVPYQSWVTVFAPVGSQLDSMTGTAQGGDGLGGGINSDVQETVDTTLNKVEFGAHFTMPGRLSKSQPPSTGTVVTKFWLPSGVNINRLMLQKQPGLKIEPVTVTVNGVKRQISLISRQSVTF